MTPRPEWTDLWVQLVDSGRASLRQPRRPEAVVRDRDARRAARRLADGDDVATTTAVRGHLELTGITTGDEVARATGLDRGRVEFALMALQGEGFAIQGRYHDAGPEVQWVSRRLLARMHSYSRKFRRSGVEPATSQDFMRFALRWQHLAPGTQLRGVEGLATVIGRLQGWEAAAAAWEPELFARRLRDYEPATLDRLCHEGEIGWLRLSPRPAMSTRPRARRTRPRRFRSCSATTSAGCSTRRATAPALCEPTVGGTAEVIEVLRARGACFAAELGAATGRLPEDVERALWDGVARGILTADGFGAIAPASTDGVANLLDDGRISRLRRADAHAAGGRRPLVARPRAERRYRP